MTRRKRGITSQKHIEYSSKATWKTILSDSTVNSQPPLKKTGMY